MAQKHSNINQLEPMTRPETGSNTKLKPMNRKILIKTIRKSIRTQQHPPIPPYYNSLYVTIFHLYTCSFPPYIPPVPDVGILT